MKPLQGLNPFFYSLPQGSRCAALEPWAEISQRLRRNQTVPLGFS